MTANQETDAAGAAQPISQEKTDFRIGKIWSSWLRQMPRLRFPAPNSAFHLIDKAKLTAYLQTVDTSTAEKIIADMEHLDVELLPFFRERDYEAKLQQNRYRLYQIGYILLSMVATLVGGLLALSLNSDPQLVPYLAFAETMVALVSVFLATIAGRRPPLPLWLDHRRRAEALRREYFRYLMDLPPYDELGGHQRKMTVSRRAAKINRGFVPGKETEE